MRGSSAGVWGRNGWWDLNAAPCAQRSCWVLLPAPGALGGGITALAPVPAARAGSRIPSRARFQGSTKFAPARLPEGWRNDAAALSRGPGIAAAPFPEPLRGAEPGLGEQPPKKRGGCGLQVHSRLLLPGATSLGFAGMCDGLCPGQAAVPRGFASPGSGFEPSSIPGAAVGAAGAQRALAGAEPP